jgi:hypothetical protein
VIRPVLAIAVLSLLACQPGGADIVESTDDADTTLAGLSGPMPTLPWSGGSGAQAPWGGTSSNNWRPEAVLANATSEALNAAWALPNVKDAIVAVPVKLFDSGFTEFGDGQANAAPSFEWWSRKRPPVIATLVHFTTGPSKILFRFEQTLTPGNDFEVQFGTQTVALSATRTATGDAVISWEVPSTLDLRSLLSTTTLLVHPKGWRDWFPIWFRVPVRPIADLKATVPASMQKFPSDGKDIVDHERVAASANPGATTTPYERLRAHSFSFTGGYNSSPYTPPGIHAIFPWNGQRYVTGVGAGWTWVAGNGPFKVMYTCFERRNQAAEASAPNGGVPSGGGWHRVGDPAETILNDLEQGPLVVASGMNSPFTGTIPGGGVFAYNLSDVAVVRWLHPGEAFITRKGDAGHSNYHWYYFHQLTEVCTEEWVHPTVPNHAYDFAPVASGAIPFGVDQAFTSFGTNVYVVGDVPELGSWNPAAAVLMKPTAYPSWSAAISLPKAVVHFKFIKRDGSGRVTWEGGADRTLDTTVSPGFTGTWR